MDHPNIVRLYEFYDEPKYYCLVQEVCQGGELFDAIINAGKFKESQARVLINRLLSVINYCHDKGIVHRDLKPENILLEPDMDFEKMKIIDFGTAIPYKEHLNDNKSKKSMQEVLGTPFYIAPEVLNASYTEKCDIWSIGVITFMLLSGKAPFFGKDDAAIFAMVRKGSFEFTSSNWKHVSSEAQ
jgi:calcium-dependent protein kinase